jgi:SAM-dependent MidA family methyltransferase
MSRDVQQRIADAIVHHGPISFAEFMELALYGPGGFYDVPPVGPEPESHFVTSPHVHPVFGELLADAIRSLWEQLGRPVPLRVVEVGAGDGTLARQLLGRLDEVEPNYVAVERSAGARAALSSAPIRVVETLEELGPLRDAVVVANELLDTLPFRRVRMRRDGPVEVRVELDGEGRPTETEVPWAELSSSVPNGLQLGREGSVPEGALEFIDSLGSALEHGYALLIDYGAAGRPGTYGADDPSPPVNDGGEVHGYRAHRLIEDVLADPGSADITAGVDFRALAARAMQRGLRVDGLPTQREALVALGFGSWIRSELARQGELLSGGAGLDAVRAWSGRSRATLLADPSGLGRLRWLMVGTSGTSPQAWLHRLGPDHDTDPPPG